MKFELIRASDYSGKAPPHPKAVREGDEWFIEIGTLEELTQLEADVGCGIILYPGQIWIYDSYME